MGDKLKQLAQWIQEKRYHPKSFKNFSKALQANRMASMIGRACDL